MNKSQAKKFEAHMQRMEQLAQEARSIFEDMEAMRDEAQEKFDNRSENWQESDKGEQAQEVLNGLDTSVSACESAADSLDEAVEGVREALAAA